jgi:hypothetical protein
MGGTLQRARAVSSVVGKSAGKNTKAGNGKPGSGKLGDGKAANGRTAARPESDVQRRMREALEAKQARDRAAHGEDHLGGRNVGPSTNDKTQRQFRRKSG